MRGGYNLSRKSHNPLKSCNHLLLGQCQILPIIAERLCGAFLVTPGPICPIGRSQRWYHAGPSTAFSCTRSKEFLRAWTRKTQHAHACPQTIRAPWLFYSAALRSFHLTQHFTQHLRATALARLCKRCKSLLPNCKLCKDL